VDGPLEPVIEDPDLCRTAAKLLPPEPWDGETWAIWSAAVKDATGAKGRALFQPLRLALTAQEQGPELKHLLPLMGRARVAARLEGKNC
jgi:glutamyl-tRNA synthetase